MQRTFTRYDVQVYLSCAVFRIFFFVEGLTEGDGVFTYPTKLTLQEQAILQNTSVSRGNDKKPWL